MAKRKKNKKKPNLPKATLERARAQARGEDYTPEWEDEAVEDDLPEDEPDTVEDDSDDDEAVSSRRSRRSSRRRSTPNAVQFSRRRGSSNNDGEALDNTALGNMLARPTKFVSEEELREEYGYVVADVRNMFILAGILFMFLVLLAQFI